MGSFTKSYYLYDFKKLKKKQKQKHFLYIAINEEGLSSNVLQQQDLVMFCLCNSKDLLFSQKNPHNLNIFSQLRQDGK